MVRRYPKESDTRAHRGGTAELERFVMQIASSEAADACERNYIDTYPYVM
jgi:hypothetical protein